MLACAWQVRIVGLSATLPNYKDVAKFLRVNLTSGSDDDDDDSDNDDDDGCDCIRC